MNSAMEKHLRTLTQLNRGIFVDPAIDPYGMDRNAALLRREQYLKQHPNADVVFGQALMAVIKPEVQMEPTNE